MGAAGLVMAGLAFVYGWWFAVVAVPLLVWAAVDVVRGLRRQHPV
jgi:hypothetical protein